VAKRKKLLPIFSKEAGAKVNPSTGDKDRQPKDSGGQPNPTTIELENEVPHLMTWMLLHSVKVKIWTYCMMPLTQRRRTRAKCL